jgi:hypothetical protein
MAAASTRLCTPSLERMLETWTLAVFAEMNSSASPRATSMRACPASAAIWSLSGGAPSVSARAAEPFGYILAVLAGRQRRLGRLQQGLGPAVWLAQRCNQDTWAGSTSIAVTASPRASEMEPSKW